MKIKKIEIGEEIINERYRPEVARYKVITLDGCEDGQCKIGCIYPNNRGDDEGVSIIWMANRDIKIAITYDMSGIIYQMSDEDIKKHEEGITENYKKIRVQEATEKRNGLCPKCGTYCYGDCESN